MRIILISTFTLALYGGVAHGQQAATQPAAERAEESDTASVSQQRRGHARAAQRLARARHSSDTADDRSPAPAGLPVSETVVNQPTPDPDPDR
ncbi:hypothetical protein [Maricaulis sp.]|uniref:hypothetical protein n=1 Tax=Maricaulis sp. TaxID=1486257 RepID=UPI002B279BE0|nr:hypothetical protein [Maricaulis sp.]